MLNCVPALPSTNHCQKLSLVSPDRHNLAHATAYLGITDERLPPKSCLDLLDGSGLHVHLLVRRSAGPLVL